MLSKQGQEAGEVSYLGAQTKRHGCVLYPGFHFISRLLSDSNAALVQVLLAPEETGLVYHPMSLQTAPPWPASAS